MSRLTILLAGLVVFVFSGAAQAAIQVDLGVPLASRPSFSLEEVNAAGGIIVDDKLFDEFRVETSATGGGLAPDASGIDVTGVEIAGELGLIFNGGWSAGAGQSVRSDIVFRVSVVEPFLSKGFLITDNSLFSTAITSAGGGVARVGETVLPADPLLLVPADPIAAKEIFHDSSIPAVKLFDHAEFGAGFPEVWIVKQVTVDGSATGQAHISEFVQTFSQIPEPGSLLLASAGGLLLLGRRRRGV